jgi:hypothetical protein
MQWRSPSRIAMLGLVVCLVLAGVFWLIPDDKTVMRAIQVRPVDSVASWPGKQKRWGLVIGVDRYADTQITTLGGSSNDAKSIADALVRYAGFPKDQVILLSSDQPAERQPTRGNILRRLSNLASVIPPDGLLFLSFAGHGMERSNQAFLLPSDAQVSNDVDLLEQTAINVAQIKDRIRRTGVKQVVLVLDACRNDPVGRANADNPLTETYVKGFNFDVHNREVTAFATLYATAVGERAYEYTEKRQGYFTWELVEGLKGAAANDKGEITLSALLTYVQDRVPKHVSADLGSGKEQRPFADIGGYQADQLVIAVASQQPVVAKSASKGPARSDAAAFELSYWETIKASNDPADFESYLRRYPDGQFTDLAMRRSRGGKGSSIEQQEDSATVVAPGNVVAPAESFSGWGKSVDSLLAEAQTRLASGALVQPAGSSAADKYRTVLKQQPGNPEALIGMQRIADTLIGNAERARKSDDVDGALRFLDQARSVQPNHPKLARLQSDLNERKVKLARRAQENEVEAGQHIAKAKIYLDRELSLRNIGEANDHYDEAISLSPTVADLPSVRKRILDGYAAAAQQELNASQPSRALKVLVYARKRNMSSPSLEKLDGTIQQQVAKR